MCGIVGILDPSVGGEAGLTGLVTRMSDCLSHRGPDDAGVWTDESLGLGLGHRRLSILDLSPTGHQPMASHSGRYIMSFNGEIYNYLDLRRELEAGDTKLRWRGHSDTEVILEAIVRWGVVGALKRMAGMFALALWDRAESTLHIARDRLGGRFRFGRTAGEWKWTGGIQSRHSSFVRQALHGLPWRREGGGKNILSLPR